MQEYCCHSSTNISSIAGTGQALHPVAGNRCLSIEMKGIALILINITLMCLIHCFSMFFAQLNIIKIDSK